MFKKRGVPALVLLVLTTLVIAALTHVDPAGPDVLDPYTLRGMVNSQADTPEGFALNYLYEAAAQETRFPVAEVRLLELAKVTGFFYAPAGRAYEVYLPRFQVKPADPAAARASGLAVDEEGWVTPAGDRGEPMLVVERKSDLPAQSRDLGLIRDGMALPGEELEQTLGTWLFQLGKDTGEDALCEAGLASLARGCLFQASGLQPVDADFTIDLSTLVVSAVPKTPDYLSFTAEGTGHGGEIRWVFEAGRYTDKWEFFSYFDQASNIRRAAPQYGLLLEGTWYYLGREGLLGGPAPDTDQSIPDPYNPEGEPLRVQTWQDLGLTVTYAPGEGTSDPPSILAMDLTKAGIPTWRGVQVGDSLEAVLTAYPENKTLYGPEVAAWETVGDLRRYIALPTSRYPLYFDFDSADTLAAIHFTNIFD